MTSSVVPPRVSVVMAARNVAAYIEGAIASVQAQTLGDFELLLVDDGSTDDTLDRVERLAQSDPRISILMGAGLGPAAARNLALEQARGVWLAVVDGDDLLEPGRLSEMVAEGEASGADLVLDNLVAFYDDGRSEHAWLTGQDWTRARSLTLDDFLATSAESGRQNPLGYLKPLLRHAFLTQHGLSYDEALFIGEDYDLVVRVLAAGGRSRYIPLRGYRYRRHAASISHRISPSQLEQMADGLQRLRRALPPTYHDRLDLRLHTVAEDLRFARQVAALKSGRVEALADVLSRPESRRRFFRAVREGLCKRLP